MSILQEIVAHKQKEVADSKELYTSKRLEQSLYFETPVVSMRQYLKRPETVGIIAEIKRKSPSAGIINDEVDIERLSISYMQAGASALSVLTDKKYFGGCNHDLEIARKFNYCPILRKDFIIDEYQIVEAKSIGADCILLIANCLNLQQVKAFAEFSHTLGLEVLLEVHSKDEIDTHLNIDIDLIGVNNRNLNAFTTDINNSLSLAPHLPDNIIRISESGIKSGKDIQALKHAGYKGFLIGGHFMSSSEPAKACSNLIADFQKLAV